MENNAELIAQCVAKAETWLTPSFDESTRADVQAMLDKADKAWGLEQAVCAASWVPAATA